MKTEAQHILDADSSPANMAAELGINGATAETIAQQYYAPHWPTMSPDLIARLPEHLRRQIEANNPNHRKQTP